MSPSASAAAPGSSPLGRRASGRSCAASRWPRRRSCWRSIWRAISSSGGCGSMRVRPRPLTIARYAYHYGDRREVRRRLMRQLAAAGLALTLGRWRCRAAADGRERCMAMRALRAGVRSRAAGLFGDHGIILGRIGRRCLMLAGPAGRRARGAAAQRQGRRRRHAESAQLAGLARLHRHQARELDADGRLSRAAVRPGVLSVRSLRRGRTYRRAGIRSSMSRPIRSGASTTCSASPRCCIPDPPNVDPFWTASARSLFLGHRALSVRDAFAARARSARCCARAWRATMKASAQHWKRDHRGPQQRTLSAVAASACARSTTSSIWRPSRPSQHPQDVHEPARSVAEPDARCGDLGQ